MVKSFDEFVSEGLWNKGLNRKKTNNDRLEDIIIPHSKEELIDIINDTIKDKTGYVDLNFIDVSKITDMSELFSHSLYDKVDIMNIDIDISKWDVSNVKDMSRMFQRSYNFNCDLSKWDVSNVENMKYMFQFCEEFNSDLSSWNVSNVKDMKFMFYGCEKFNSDLSKWDVSNVKNMKSMFNDCYDMYKIPNWYK